MNSRGQKHFCHDVFGFRYENVNRFATRQHSRYQEAWRKKRMTAGRLSEVDF